MPMAEAPLPCGLRAAPPGALLPNAPFFPVTPIRQPLPHRPSRVPDRAVRTQASNLVRAQERKKKAKTHLKLTSLGCARRARAQEQNASSAKSVRAQVKLALSASISPSSPTHRTLQNKVRTVYLFMQISDLDLQQWGTIDLRCIRDSCSVHLPASSSSIWFSSRGSIPTSASPPPGPTSSRGLALGLTGGSSYINRRVEEPRASRAPPRRRTGWRASPPIECAPPPHHHEAAFGLSRRCTFALSSRPRAPHADIACPDVDRLKAPASAAHC